MEALNSSKLRNSPPFRHPKHCSGYAGSNFRGREKPISGNGGCSDYPEESEQLISYWGRVRKPAVKSKLTVTTHTHKSVRGVNYSSWEEKRFMGVGINNARQPFDEMPERNMKGYRAKNGDTQKGIVKKYDGNKALNYFRAMCKFLKKKADRGVLPCKKRIDIEAYNKLRDYGKLLNIPRIIGPIPGVEIGDEFEFRMELKIIGLHRPPVHGIDSMVGPNGKTMATSIVSTEGYLDKMVNPNMLRYTGEGGGIFEAKGKKGSKDQELKGGNLALYNSFKEGNFVRVIRGVKPNSGYVSYKGGIGKTLFVYDGLYNVVGFYKERGANGNMIFQFELERCPAQTSILWDKYR